MITDKLISLRSQHTEAQRLKKFVRKNTQSFHSSRAGSLRKQALIKHENQVSTNNGNDSSIKMQTESARSFKNQQQFLLFSPKKNTQSLKLPLHKGRSVQQFAEIKEKQEKHQQSNAQLQSLRTQCKKMKLYLDEERQKRKFAEEEVMLNHIQIKRLQRRLQKYKTQKEILQTERQQMLKHIQLLQNRAFDSQTQGIHTYRLSIMEQEVNRLKEVLSKRRSARQNELLKQLDMLFQEKYALNKQINSNIIANNFLTKQLSDMDQQLEQARVNSQRKAVSSYEYIQLRQRYKMLLVQHRQLREQMHTLLQARSKDNMSRINITSLTISNDSSLIQ